MLTSLALVFLVGLALAALCQKLKLPRIIGMLATGILLPFSKISARTSPDRPPTPACRG